jgi:hypothetical protein
LAIAQSDRRDERFGGIYGRRFNVRKRFLTRRVIAAAISIGLLGVVYAAPQMVQGAADTGAVTLSVQTAYSDTAKLPFRDFDAVAGVELTEFTWILNEDNTGSPAFDPENCLPEAAQDSVTPTAGTGDFPASCTWPSVRSVDGHSRVVATGDQTDWDANSPLTLPNGKYLVSVISDGFKIDGRHFTVAGDTTSVPVRMNPLPLPSVTVRVNVFNDNAMTNGQFDGTSETTTDMSGFSAYLNDVAGEIDFDVYGNALCTEYEVDANGRMIFDDDGSPIPVVLDNGGATGNHLAAGETSCISDENGQIVIPNLGPNRYAVNVSPPDPQTAADELNPWIQTTTLEGGHDWDTWNMEGATGYDLELVIGGESVPFVHFGFVRRQNSLPADAPGSISGRVMVGRTYISQTGGLPDPGTRWGGGTGTLLERPVEDAWVSLACLTGCPGLAADSAVYVEQANADGTFTIDNVPDGTYNLAIWDEAQIRILDFIQVSVINGQSVNIGNFPLAGWFTDLEGSIFLDRNGNGRRDGVGTPLEEPGVPDFGLTLRTRVNTLQDQGQASAVTDGEGAWDMAAYPLGRFLILEAYHSAYKTTGITWKLTNESTEHTFLTEQVDFNVLNIVGQTVRVDIGVVPYARNENGGIVGTVSYDVTRNELNPRNAATEDWQPGVPDMTMQLWKPNKLPGGSFELAANGAIKQYGIGGCARPEGEYGTVDVPGGCDPLQEPQATEHWTQPTGCVARTADGSPAFTKAFVNNGSGHCYEAPLSGVQIGTDGAVDGNWGFGDLGSGDYLVEAVSPLSEIDELAGRPIYKFTDEAAINVFRGDSYVSQGPWVHNPAAIVGPDPTTVPVPVFRENTSESACAGAMHEIIVTDQTFLDGGGSPLEGTDRPYCDVKLVRVQPRRSIAPIFHVFTDVPVPTRFVGYIIDDLSISSDPKSMTFGEKAGMQNVPIGIYDYRGRHVTTAESDFNGNYEVLLPSSDTIACPTPSGVCPNVYRMVGNDPGQLGAPNANFNPQYRTVGTQFQGWPGVMHPVDQAPTRIAASFQAPGSQALYPAVCAAPANKPVFYRISQPYGAADSGPYTITGTGFGSTAGTLQLGANTLPAVNVTSWTNTSIVFTLPSNAPVGAQMLRIHAANAPILTDDVRSTNAVTFHVTGLDVTGFGYEPTVITVGTGMTHDPAADPVDGAGPRAIQRALDAAAALGPAANPLVVVYPNLAPQYAPFNPDNAYFENIVIHSRVKLQGVGAGGLGVPGSRIDGRYFWTAPDGPGPAYEEWWQDFVSGLPVAGNAADIQGQVVYVRPETATQFDGAFNTAIDGFTITGGDQQGFPTNLNFVGAGPNGDARPTNVQTQGGGVFINAYAKNTAITNNVFQSNGGSFGGAIRVGSPDLGNGAGPNGTENVALADNHNDGVRILRNKFVANGATMLAGAIGIFYGADNYEIGENDICGNAGAEYGGGITHYGRSPGGRIHHNRIFFNQAYDEGGGIMITGELPAVTTVLSSGSGSVTIDHNLIAANLANDDGGGIRFLMAAGPGNDPMVVRNNIIANNVSTHEGGGIAIDNTPNVRIINNTIVKNVTTATAMTSTGKPAPAGVSTGDNTALLQAALNNLYGAANAPQFSNPVLLNNVFADNRAGTWNVNGVTGIGLEGDTSPHLRWDVGASDGSGTVTVYGSLVDSNESSPAYGFGASGFNLGAGSTDIQDGANSGIAKIGFIETYDSTVSIANWRTFPNFRPAAIVTLGEPLAQVANYHLKETGRPTPEIVVNKALATLGAAEAAPYGVQTPPATDIDDSARPFPVGASNIDIGADEVAPLPAPAPTLPPPPPPIPSLAALPVVDNFNRGNSSPFALNPLGNGWQARSFLNAGTFRVNSGTALGGTVPGFYLRTNAMPGATQGTGFTVAQVPNATGNQTLSMILKANGTTSYSVGFQAPSRFIEVRFSRTGATGTATSAPGQVQIGYGITTGGLLGKTTHNFGPAIPLTLKNGDKLVAVARSNGVVDVWVDPVGAPAAYFLGTRTLSGGTWTSAWNTQGGQTGMRYGTTLSSAQSSTMNIRLDDFRGGNV